MQLEGGADGRLGAVRRAAARERRGQAGGGSQARVRPDHARPDEHRDPVRGRPRAERAPVVDGQRRLADGQGRLGGRVARGNRQRRCDRAAVERSNP